MVYKSLQALSYLVQMPTIPLYSKCRLSLLPGILEMLNLRCDSKFPQPESAFYQDSQSVHEDMKSWEVCQWSVEEFRLQPSIVCHSLDRRNWLRNGYVFREMLEKEVLFLWREPEEAIVSFSLILLCFGYNSWNCCSLLMNMRMGRGKKHHRNMEQNPDWATFDPYPTLRPSQLSVIEANISSNTLTDSLKEAIS